MVRPGRDLELRDDDSEVEEADDEPEDSPADKRQRTEVPGYPKGTVKQVKVFNFMTYGEPAVTITPGPRLNLVLGPNGTGKSSLVCALCVGLGGSTKLLGRADNVKDYIRRGCDRGWVETCLSGGPGRPDITIHCELVKEGERYKTNWKINRVTKTKTEVQELVKSLNIQFDNLCQFLPQDKVVEFARMDQYELLVATEKAIGDASLHETHTRLIEKRIFVKEKQVAHQASQRRHEQLVAENQKLERDYDRFRRRQKLADRIALMKKKLAWMGVKEAQEKAAAADAEAGQATAALKEAQKEARQDEGPAKQRQQEAEAAKRSATDLSQVVRVKEKEFKAAVDKVQKEEEAVRELRGRLNGLADESAKLQEAKDRMRTKMTQVEASQRQLPPVPDNTAQQQALTDQMTAIREQLANLEGDKMHLLEQRGAAATEHARIQADIRQCDNVKYQRAQALKSLRGMMGLESATRWVEAQRAAGAFRGEVVGPIGLEIKVKLARCAQYLENATFQQLCNFVAQYPEDEQLLMREFKAQGIRSNVIAVGNDYSQPLVSDAAKYSSYGVICSLDDVYDAPPIVKHALANMCGLDKVYAVDHNDTDRVQQLMEQHGVKKVFTPQVVVNFVASAYGGREDCGILQAPLYPSRVLAGAAGADVEERRRDLQARLAQVAGHIQQLDAQVAAADARAGPLSQQLEQLQAQKTALVKEVANLVNKRNNLARAYKIAVGQLQKYEAQQDPLTQAPALQRKLAKALIGHHAQLTAQLRATRAQWDALQQHAVAEMAWRELDMQARGMQAALTARRDSLRALEVAAKAAAARAKAAVRAFTDAKAAAQEEHPVNDRIRERFAQMPDDRDELLEALAAVEAEVAGIAVNNPRVVEEYKKRQEDIARLEGEATALAQELEAAEAEIEGLKAAWLPELQRVVGEINASFSTNFAQIGCAGEVLLGQHEDYDKFSIQIKVKFRESEELQLLTAHRQSGGERSVSTILYLIALQGVTVTPFRVVDEINQGMDPVNERKVFMQLVEASCQEGTPQCFLLTPKLLPDLPFTQDITVLNIFNGGLITEQVAGQYTRETLFGSIGMAALRRVPVAG